MTKEKIIDNLARLMANQAGAERIEEAEKELWHPDDWIAIFSHYDNREDRYGSYFRAKAEKFYDRWMLIQMASEGTE